MYATIDTLVSKFKLLKRKQKSKVLESLSSKVLAERLNKLYQEVKKSPSEHYSFSVLKLNIKRRRSTVACVLSVDNVLVNFIMKWTQIIFILHSANALCSIQKILVHYKVDSYMYLPTTHAKQCFDNIQRSFGRFSEDFRRFSKCCPKVIRTFSNIFRRFPRKIKRCFEKNPCKTLVYIIFTIIITVGMNRTSSMVLRAGWQRMAGTTCGTYFIKASFTKTASCPLEINIPLILTKNI